MWHAICWRTESAGDVHLTIVYLQYLLERVIERCDGCEMKRNRYVVATEAHAYSHTRDTGADTSYRDI